MKTNAFRFVITFLGMLLFGPVVHAAEPSRGRRTFDDGWKFVLGDPKAAEVPTFDDGGWSAVDLPHDWSIFGPFDKNAAAGGSGAYLPTGIGWYRKTFTLAKSDKDRAVSLEFDGIYQNSETWLNGHLLGSRPFGYIGFAYDITPYLNPPGQPNVVAVRVDNSHQRNSRWYSGSGIYRHTWLLSTDPLHIAHWGARVTTPQLSPEAGTIDVVLQVQNLRTTDAAFDWLCTLIDPNGKQVAALRSSRHLNAGAAGEFTSQLAIAKPQLWSVQTPALYTVRCQLLSDGQVIDEDDTPIGLRTIVFDVDKGCLLNGIPIKLNGVCLHEDGGAVGSAIPEGVWIRRLKLLKEMGCNAIRTSHNPPAPEFLDLCDKMGFLVMDEAFDEWRDGKVAEGYHKYFSDWSQRDLADFIARDRNHPSVALWSAGNEISEQSSWGGADVLRKLIDTFHKEDPARPVTAACDRVYAEPESAKLDFVNELDIVGYNYVDRWRDRANTYYTTDRGLFPQRRFVGTESVSMAGVRGDYSNLFDDDPEKVPTEKKGIQRLPESTRRINVEQLWKFVRTNDYVIGDFMWTGIDYLGEAGWPDKNATFGALDTCGFKKDGYYFYQSQWTSGPVLHLFPHWNWKGREGQIIPVMCYTNCGSVELFLNGQSFGKKGYEFPVQGMEERYGKYPARATIPRTTGDLHLCWDVPYEPGTLKVVGRIGDKTVSEEIATTGMPAAIRLSVDRKTLLADGRDVAHITVEIVDSQGRVVPDADNHVTFELQGTARLIGVDNGNPASHESFKASQRDAFNGMCLAILQSTRSAGAIQFSARSTGLSDASVEISSAAAVQTAH
jgi:beta-galactosidase